MRGRSIRRECRLLVALLLGRDRNQSFVVRRSGLLNDNQALAVAAGCRSLALLVLRV